MATCVFAPHSSIPTQLNTNWQANSSHYGDAVQVQFFFDNKRLNVDSNTNSAKCVAFRQLTIKLKWQTNTSAKRSRAPTQTQETGNTWAGKHR